MSLRHSYTIIAPLYDALLETAATGVRAASLGQLPQRGGLNILINGIGSGLDLPHLSPSHSYTGLDITAAMLNRAKPRIGGLRLNLVQGDGMALPFASKHFLTMTVLHLILAIVPDARAGLRETARVLKPGGSVLNIYSFQRGENCVDQTDVESTVAAYRYPAGCGV